MSVLLLTAVAVVMTGMTVREVSAQEPALPPGLIGGPTLEEPILPQGLDEVPSPRVPQGTVPPMPSDAPGDTDEGGLPFRLNGYLEGRAGARTEDDTTQRRLSILETRLQLEAERYFEDPALTLKLTTDFLYDDLEDSTPVDVESGEGFFDLREAFIQFSPLEFADVKAGRQILTWGTGDLVFINDLFPKDFRAFFVGRDEEYLKAPSDAVKLSLFSDLANLDVVYTPRFDADRFVDGRRLSFYDPVTGRIVGGHGDPVAQFDQPDAWFQDEEWAVRVYRNLEGTELAAYGYYGFWKNPAGRDRLTGQGTFPALAVYGASVRGTVLGGIGHAEFGYYDSLDDRQGDDPLIRNGELRFLLGFEREVARNLTWGVQYAAEHMLAHEAYLRTLPANQSPRDQTRHLLTQRLTWLTHDQTVTWSLFTFFSPSDLDAYLRPRVAWKVTDAWRLELGANIFAGSDDDTFFGQLENNTNVYAGVRYGF